MVPTLLNIQDEDKFSKVSYRAPPRIGKTIFQSLYGL